MKLKKKKSGQRRNWSPRPSWETVGELCQKEMTPALAQRLASLVESREQGTLPEQIFFRDVLAVMQSENAKKTKLMKRRLTQMANLRVAVTDHFLARLIARHYRAVVAFVMDPVRRAVERARKNGESKIFLDDEAVVFDPQSDVLISIYPKLSLRPGH